MEGNYFINSYFSKQFTNFTKLNFDFIIKFPLKRLTNFNQEFASYFIINFHSILTYYHFKSLIMDIMGSFLIMDIMGSFLIMDIMDSFLIMDIMDSSFLIIANLKMHYSSLTQLGSYFTYFTSFPVIAQLIKHFPNLPFMANSIKLINTQKPYP